MRASKFLFACLLAVATACGGSSGDEAMIEKSVVMMEDLAKVVDSAGEDCAKMASGVEGVLKSNEGNIAKLKEMKEKYKEDKEGREKMKKAAEKYKDRMMAVMPKMMGMAKCKDDPKMKEMEDKLRALR